MASKAVRFTTRELSLRTFSDFERFFSQVHGCACTLYFFGRHLTPVAQTAKERAELVGAPDRTPKHFPHQALMRERELAAVRELVEQRKAHGILVYDDADPVGWCHFGRADEVPVNRDDTTPAKLSARDPSAQWRITCFTTRIGLPPTRRGRHGIDGGRRGDQVMPSSALPTESGIFGRVRSAAGKSRPWFQWRRIHQMAAVRSSLPAGVGLLAKSKSGPLLDHLLDATCHRWRGVSLDRDRAAIGEGQHGIAPAIRLPDNSPHPK